MFKISVTENKETNCKNCVIINVNYVLFIKSNEHVSFARSCNIILEALNLHVADTPTTFASFYSFMSKSIDMSNWFTRRMTNKKQIQEIARHIFRLGTGWIFVLIEIT